SEPGRREALLAVLLIWSVVPAIGAVPFVVTGGMSPLNALFESMSAFTTTGATVLSDFGAFTSSLFMWRAAAQWIGGIGIIVIFVSLFPRLAIAGRQLFFTEAPGPTDERLTPKLRHTATTLLTVYGGLTVACALAYWAAGMTLTQAVSHSFSTLSAGGFSSEAASFAGFESRAVEWVGSVFMFLAGVNFALQYRVYTRRPRALLADVEFRAYLLTVLAASIAVAYFLWDGGGIGEAMRTGIFQVVSILTTTGYASTDFAVWGPPAQIVLVALMFVGGSAGSAAGGVKVVRWLIVLRQSSGEVRRALHPRAVLPVRLGSQIVPDAVVRSVAAFITLYVLVFACSTAVLAMLGTDLVTSFSAAIACLGNIGPGLADVGPMESFADLPALGRAVLTFDMYAGRLEVVTVFAVLTRDWWRVPPPR
ncbi:MAG TPA: TrkH family potassium uptake protein, partial [Trueperaceae bacterium]